MLALKIVTDMNPQDLQNIGPAVMEAKLRRLLNLKINTLGLKVRTYTRLWFAHIETLGQLASKSERDLIEIRGFGKKSLRDVITKIEPFGLTLGMTFED